MSSAKRPAQSSMDTWLKHPKIIRNPDSNQFTGEGPSNIENAVDESMGDNIRHKDIGISQLPAQHQPSVGYKFPRDKIGRACQQSWFSTYKWLHYSISEDFVLCFQCMQVRHMKGAKSVSGVEEAFVIKGFRNWKKGPEKLEAHAKSDQHIQSIHYVLQKNKGTPVVDMIVKQSKGQQEESRRAMRCVISSIRYLARTGQALRGHANEDGNLRKLLEERCDDVPISKSWLLKRENWLDGKIQNEILEIMAHIVQRELTEEIKRSPFIGVIADGTTDVAGSEQFSLCLRWMNPETMELREDFMGLYLPPSSKAQDLFASIQDILLRLGLGFENVRGHCFDGAACMSGHLHGVQKLITDIQPKSIFVHCSNHSLDLVLQEAGRTCTVLCDALSLVRDVSNIILESSKRRTVYSNVVLAPCSKEEKILNILPLCPTRWSVRVKALVRFIDNYKRVQETIKCILEEPGAIRDDRRAVLKGYQNQLQKSKTLFNLKVAAAIFGPCEQLALALQKPGCIAAGSKQSAELLFKTISNMRTDSVFERIWSDTKKVAEELCLQMPQPPRQQIPPRRFEYTEFPTPPATIDAQTNLRKTFFEVLDRVSTELQRRFSQPGMETLVQLEKILINAAGGKSHSKTEIEELLKSHKTDFVIDKLVAQLVMLPTVLNDAAVSSLTIAENFRNQPQTVRDLLDQVVRLVQLLLIVPASSATAERSFSALRHVKTDLRSTMLQKRLNHLLLLYIHQNHTSRIILDDILKEFISRTAERLSIFGNI